MDITQVLHDFGLTGKEPDVFLAILKTEGIQPASVIAKKANMNRTTTYKILLKLAKMGLVAKSMRHGGTAFFVDDPEKSLETLLIIHRKKLDSLNARMGDLLREIKSFARHELTLPHMRVYDGFAGVVRAYEDTVAEKYTIRSFENIEQMPQQVKDYMEKVFVPKRVEKGNFAYVLAPENKLNVKARREDKKYLRGARFAPKDKLPLETGINIYGNKISFFSYDPDDMFGVVIESKRFANSLRVIFDFCWEHAK
ncbi:hypothetical protein JXA05_02005 [Candidatus Peregrinibacteria bacterium]|nr:hypothetical protein [Candidatus Peregrinibacteria bacterium]